MFVQRPHPYQQATGHSEPVAAAANQKSSTPPDEGSMQRSEQNVNVDDHSSKGNATDQVTSTFGDMSIHSNVAVSIQRLIKFYWFQIIKKNVPSFIPNRFKLINKIEQSPSNTMANIKILF